MKEMTLDDEKDLRQCFLYQMAKTEYLKWFTDVVLMHNTYDEFCPEDSSRMQVDETKR